MKDISERKDVELLVHTFYEQVLQDEILNPYFTEAVAVNWSSHLPRMVDFWESLLLDGTHYHGNPMQKHIHLHQIMPLKEEAFERWIQLFTSVLHDHFSGPVAELAHQRALSIATVIRLKTTERSQSGN